MKTISIGSIRSLDKDQEPGWLDRLARRIVLGRLSLMTRRRH